MVQIHAKAFDFFLERMIDQNVRDFKPFISIFFFMILKVEEIVMSQLEIAGYSLLNSSQKIALQKCIAKKNGGLSAGIGFGKTITAMVLALHYNKIYGKPSLIVVNKTLLGNWINEWKKFYGPMESPPLYQVFHSDVVKDMDAFVIQPTTQFIFTTGEALAKVYNNANIASRFIYMLKRDPWSPPVTHYNSPRQPFLQHEGQGGRCFYAMKWSCVIVDEVQRFCNILTRKCCAVGSISSHHRWALSGTMFDEPKIEKVLGYYVIINHPTFPRNLPDTAEICIKGPFEGLKESMVFCDPQLTLSLQSSSISKKLPTICYHIVSHDLRPEEEAIYCSMKQNMKNISSSMKNIVNVAQKRKFCSYLLALLTYLRQCIVSPMIPIASACLDTYDMTSGSDLSRMMSTSFLSTPGVKQYIENSENVVSSRIQHVLNTLALHPQEKTIVFTTFRSCLNLIKTIVERKTKRDCSTISSDMRSLKRQQVIETFNAAEDAPILFLTYDIGAEGLNLQTCRNMILVDLYWNKSKADQAIGRIVRQGQLADEVSVYFITSNTAIEEAVFTKQIDKLDVIQQLLVGTMKSQVKTISTQDIVRFINLEDNVNMLKTLQY